MQYRVLIRTLICLSLFILLTLVPQGRSWASLFTMSGFEDEELGASVAGVGDLNGDLVPDILVGVPGYGGELLGGRGRAVVYSGADGTVLFQWIGQSDGDRLGLVVAAAGDLDGDTVPDLLIGEPNAEISAGIFGRVTARSGADGSVIHLWEADAATSGLGFSMAAAGDVDKDGRDDVIIGSPLGFNQPVGVTGAATVFSGDDGQVLQQWHGLRVGGLFGRSVGAADSNDDQQVDLFVGEYGDYDPYGYGKDDGGEVKCLDGNTGLVRWSRKSTDPSDGFGMSLAILPDISGDGLPELLVGSPYRAAVPWAAGPGRVSMYSAVDGALVLELDGGADGDLFGLALASAGNVGGGDDLPDFLVGCGDRALLYSGMNPYPRMQATGWAQQTPEGLGNALASAGDLDGDGLDDILLGGSGYGGVFGGHSGRVLAYGRSEGIDVTLDSLTPDVLPGSNIYLHATVVNLSMTDISVNADLNISLPDGSGFTGLRHSNFILPIATQKEIPITLSVPGLLALDLVNDFFEFDLVVTSETWPQAYDVDQTAMLISEPARLSPSHVLQGETSENGFGQSLAVVDDLSGDGLADLLVGDPVLGRVYVFAGAGQSLLYRVVGEAPRDEFGAALRGVGDLDGDGRTDFLVGAPGRAGSGGSLDAGRAYLYSGASGSLIQVFDGDAADERLGSSVAGPGDVNGDGLPDLALGGPGYQGVLGPEQGQVRVYSGAAGHGLLYSVEGGTAGALLGSSLAAVGDQDGDAAGDMLVGSPNWSTISGEISPGRVQLLGGADGGQILVWAGHRDNDRFGEQVAAVDDATGDGRMEFLMSAPGSDVQAIGAGAGMVFFNAGGDGTLLRRFEGLFPGDGFGQTLTGGGDLSGDGVPDLATGAPLHTLLTQPDGSGSVSQCGRVLVYGGVIDDLHFALNGLAPGYHLGRALAFYPDADNNGRGELMVAYRTETSPGIFAGSVAMYQLMP